MNRVHGWRHPFILVVFLTFCPFFDLSAWPDTEGGKMAYMQIFFKDDAQLRGKAIKSIAQDSLGFLWVVTDDGPFRFNQRHFESFPDQHFAYPKSLLRQRNGRLWLLGDMGLVEIFYERDSVRFQLTVEGSSRDLNENIYYGKNLYEDRQGALWIGGYQHIYRYQNGQLSTYRQGPELGTQDFDYAYSFAQDASGRLWTAAYAGKLGYYDPTTDRWEWVIEHELQEAADLKYDSLQNCLWLGSAEGLARISLNEQDLPGQVEWFYRQNQISRLLVRGKKIWWGNREEEIYVGIPSQKDPVMAGRFNRQEVHCFLPGSDGLWVGSTNSLMYLYPALVHPVQKNNQPSQRYIESLTSHDGRQYYCDRYYLYRIDQYGEVDTLLHDPQAYFLSVTYARDSLWLFSRNGVMAGPEEDLRWLSRQKGDFFMSGRDSKENIWICHMDRLGVSRFMPDGSFQNYMPADSAEISLTVVRQAPDGTLYFGGSGYQHLLYRYNVQRDEIENLLPPQSVPAELCVQDLQISPSGIVWIASSHGLYSWTPADSQLQFHPLPLSQKAPSLLALAWENERRIWLSHEQELFAYNPESHEISLLNDLNGLPGANLCGHNLMLDRSGLWIGTHRGMYFLHPGSINIQPTPPPNWLALSINHEPGPTASQILELPHNSDLRLQPGFEDYPLDLVQFRYRISGTSDQWTYLERDKEILLSDLESGKHSLAVQARKLGAHQWSLSRILIVSVLPPWYLSLPYWLVGLLLLGLTIWSFTYFKTRVLQRKKKSLEKLVHFKTEALQEALLRERQIQTALRHSEARYRQLFETARDGIMLIKDDKVFEANEQAWKMFGYTQESFIGKPLPDLYPAVQPDGRLSEEKALRQLARSRWDAHYEHWKQIRADKSLFDAELSLNRVRIDEEVYIQVIFRNITDKVEAKEEQLRQLIELNRKNEELKRYIASNAELENFAYVVSHDLRQPLRSISGFAGLLQNRYSQSLDDQGREFLDFIVRGATRMNELILDLLEYSRINRTHEPKAWVALPELMNEVLGLLQAQIQETKAEISIANLPEVQLFGHRTQLLRVIQNLVSNALKFHKIGEVPNIAIDARLKDRQLYLKISDNGIGIDPENFDRIFWLFQKLHLDDQYEGSGIGLAVCKKILEHHDGSISLVSTLGGGSTFEIRLPHILGPQDTQNPPTDSLPAALSWLEDLI